ncbi:MAG: 2-hydroxychromene-2-carboxylate isomerase [Pseudomonadota bacterium]
MPKLTFYFEFASTYSYLTASRIADAAALSGVEVVWRPFLLGPIFAAQGMTTSPFNIFPTKGAYMWRDLGRRAALLGLPPITRPNPFPQNGLLAARVATIGRDEPWGPAFVRGVYAAQFARGKQISDHTTLVQILTEIGLDASHILHLASTDQTVKDTLRRTTEEAQAMGIFGAPSFVTEDGELFWGDDRLEDSLAWAMACHVKPVDIP